MRNGRQEVRSLFEPLDALSHHEERVVSRNISCSPHLHTIAPEALHSTGRSQMNNFNVTEVLSLPAKTVCLTLIHCTPAGSPDKTADIIPAPATIELNGTAHVEGRVSLKPQFSTLYEV